jgi:cephalosporin hydroxylase
MFFGCLDSESNDSVASPTRSDVDRADQYATDVEAFERAVGKNEGLAPEQIHKIMEEIRNSPLFKNTFMGVSTLQNPTDLWILMEIMYEMKPDLIVEAGTFHGGSAGLWAILLEHMNPNGRVITIDIDDRRDKRAINWPISKRKVDFLLGSSTDPAIVADVHRRAKGKRVMVILDSLHSKEHVANELKAYSPLIPVDGYIVVQDTESGPLEAIDEFLAANDSFVADRAKERYSDTNTVRGYLKRIRP